MDATEILARLEKLEDACLSSVQEIRSLKAEVEKASSGNPTLEPLLDSEQVAKILGVEPGYVYSQARAKKIPSVRFGKYRRFCPVQLKKWIERKKSI
jgi:excisionase family DNA binding protein